jgi:hypothetical protein
MFSIFDRCHFYTVIFLLKSIYLFTRLTFVNGVIVKNIKWRKYLMKKFNLALTALLLLASYSNMVSADKPNSCIQNGEFQRAEMNDRNATTKGATGFVVLGLLKRGEQPVGIFKENALQASNLKPNHDYYVIELVQLAGAFGDPALQISQPNAFRSTVTTNDNGRLVTGGTFPGPAAALAPGDYRVDVVVTDTEMTYPPSTPEGYVIMDRIGSLAGLASEPLLTSETFYKGIEITVPAE